MGACNTCLGDAARLAEALRGDCEAGLDTEQLRRDLALAEGRAKSCAAGQCHWRGLGPLDITRLPPSGGV
jgi:hypothetical protein